MLQTPAVFPPFYGGRGFIPRHFMGALRAAFGGGGEGFPPALTFAVTASGVSIWSIGAPFWGLAIGLVAMALSGLQKAGRRA